MVRPVTRNQRIATWFNNAAWPVEYDTALMDALQRRTRNIADLSSSDVFEAVIEQVWADMVRLLGRSFSLHEVKVRITTIRRRFYQFMLFTTLPGVNFNRHTARLRIGAEYTQHLNGESAIRRYFRLTGFPYYHTCNDIFEYKNAAPVNFNGVQGYNPEAPIEIEDSENADNAIVAFEGNEENGNTDGNSGVAADSAVVTHAANAENGNMEGNNAIVVYEGHEGNSNMQGNNVVHGHPNNNAEEEHEQQDYTESLMENMYGWGSDDSYHSDASQNTWSR